MERVISNCQNIYSHLQDAESKYVFEKRILFNLSGRQKYIDDMAKHIVNQLPQKEHFEHAIEICRKNIKHLVLYGIGRDYIQLVKLYPELSAACLCDRSKRMQKEGFNGIPVISPEVLIERKSSVFVVICSSLFHKEIYDFLISSGFEPSQIINLGGIVHNISELQYFKEPFLPHTESEVFIDGGCYDCDSSLQFQKWCNYSYKNIYAYEPDIDNYQKCLNILAQNPIDRFTLYNKGLWDINTELQFKMEGSLGSKIVEEEKEEIVKIQTVTIDDTIKVDDKVTFIKLDVEGAELKALHGAKKTILRDHPKLAVCLYHKPEDIFQIPEYILSLHDNYKLFLRHYNIQEEETVLYAI